MHFGKTFVKIGISALLLLIVSAGVSAYEESDIVIRNMWARATITPEVMSEMSGTGGMMATPEAEATQAMGGMMGQHGGMGQPGGMMNMVDISAVYFLLENRGMQPIRLIAASTPVATTVEIHETTMEGEVMRMRPLENGITVAPGETVELRQGGLHIMLIGLIQPLVDGSAIPLELTFDMLNEAGEVEGDPVVLMTAAPVFLTPPEPTPFYIIGGWARPTVFGAAMSDTQGQNAEATPEMMGPGPDISAGYFTLVNAGDSDDTLIAASTPAATVTELHTMVMEGDVMRMRQIEGGVPVPAGGTAVFRPRAEHIMFIGLTEPLVEGTAIPLTLTFASGLQMTVALPVYDRAMMEMEMMSGHSHGG
ncbi:MAG: copper chaperone PCu(A)C [Candidatus Flexifilum sp.]|jgi:copper(I)-binding protein